MFSGAYATWRFRIPVRPVPTFERRLNDVVILRSARCTSLLHCLATFERRACVRLRKTESVELTSGYLRLGGLSIGAFKTTAEDVFDCGRGRL